MKEEKPRLRLAVEGNTTMDVRITHRPAFHLVGHTARVPLIHGGANPHVERHIASVRESEHARLDELGNTEPSGLLQVSADVDPDDTEGSEFTYLHGIALDETTTVPHGLDVINVPVGWWGVFRSSGRHPAALEADAIREWFPFNPWHLRPGPSIAATLDRADYGATMTELWLPIEHGSSVNAC